MYASSVRTDITIVGTGRIGASRRMRRSDGVRLLPHDRMRAVMTALRCAGGSSERGIVIVCLEHHMRKAHRLPRVGTLTRTDANQQTQRQEVSKDDQITDLPRWHLERKAGHLHVVDGVACKVGRRPWEGDRLESVTVSKGSLTSEISTARFSARL